MSVCRNEHLWKVEFVYCCRSDVDFREPNILLESYDSCYLVVKHWLLFQLHNVMYVAYLLTYLLTYLRRLLLTNSITCN